MFDIGWTEMLVIAVVMILVVGPKDLPGMLRTIGKTVGNLRRMAGDFQRQFSDALKEADIDEVKKDLAQSTSVESLLEDPLSDINQSADELMGSLDIDDDDGDLAKAKFDKIQEEIAEGKAKEKSAAVTASKSATSKQKPVKKAPAKKAVAKKTAAKPATKPVAKRKPAPKSKATTSKASVGKAKTGSKTA